MKKSKKEKARQVIENNISVFFDEDICAPDVSIILEQAESIQEGQSKHYPKQKKAPRLVLVLSLFTVLIMGSVLLFVPPVRAGIIGIFAKDNAVQPTEGAQYLLIMDGVELVNSSAFENGSISTLYTYGDCSVFLFQENITHGSDVYSDTQNEYFEENTPLGIAYCIDDADGYNAALILDEIKITVVINSKDYDLFKKILFSIDKQ